jgi:hypothetical protein
MDYSSDSDSEIEDKPRVRSTKDRNVVSVPSFNGVTGASPCKEPVKSKRPYIKKPRTEEQKKELVDRLAKARMIKQQKYQETKKKKVKAVEQQSSDEDETPVKKLKKVKIIEPPSSSEEEEEVIIKPKKKSKKNNTRRINK